MGREKRKHGVVYLISMLCLSVVCQADVVDKRPTSAIDVPEIKRSSKEESKNFQGPSFDCSKASTKVEKTICDYRYLSDLDRKLDEVYKQKRAIPKIRENVRKSQLNWLRDERATCESVEGMAFDGSGPRIVSCISSAYRNRIQELNDLEGSGGSPPAGYPLSKTNKYKITKGRQYELCHRYVDLMSRVRPNPRSSCDLPYPFDEIALEQGFSEISWKKVGKNEHRDAIMDYWEKPNPYARNSGFKRDMKTEEGKKSFAEFFSRIDVLWRVTMDLNFDGHDEVVYRLPNSGQCSGHRHVYFIDDPTIPMEHAHRSRLTGDIFYYKGRAYNYHGIPGSGQSVYEPYGGEYVVNEKYVCRFDPITKEQ